MRHSVLLVPACNPGANPFATPLATLSGRKPTAVERQRASAGLVALLDLLLCVEPSARPTAREAEGLARRLLEGG